MEMSIEAVFVGLLRTVNLDVTIRPEEVALIASSILRCGAFLKISFADDMERKLFLFPCVLENPGIVVGLSSRLRDVSPSNLPDQFWAPHSLLFNR
jgi:hypothetical protein